MDGDEWRGWWETISLPHASLVLTHYAREPLVMKGDLLLRH
jgi:hypothetical protein